MRNIFSKVATLFQRDKSQDQELERRVSQLHEEGIPVSLRDFRRVRTEIECAMRRCPVTSLGRFVMSSRSLGKLDLPGDQSSDLARAAFSSLAREGALRLREEYGNEEVYGR